VVGQRTRRSHPSTITVERSSRFCLLLPFNQTEIPG
jgi:hypothetical protein